MNASRIMKYKRARTRSELATDHAEANYTDAEFLSEEAENLIGKNLLIHEWTAEDVNADKSRVGLPGSPTKVKKIQSVILTGGEGKSIEPTEAGINDLIHELIEDHTLG